MAKKKNYKDTLNEISQILESQGIKSSNEEIAQKYANRQDVQLRDTTSTANKWLNTGAFKDGYQFGDVSKSIMGTAQNIQQNINKGAFSTAEGILDLGSNLVGMGAEAIGQNKFGKKAKEFAQKDIASILFPDTKAQRENTVLGGKSQNIAQGVGQVGSTIALGILTGGSSLATTGAIGLSATGSGINEALQGGATNDEAVKYGLISGLAEAGSEMLFGGLAKGVNVLGVGKGLSSVDDMLAKKVSSLFESHLAKNLSQYAIKASGEGLEEVISGFAQAIGKKLTYMKDEDLAKLIQDEQLLDQFIAGTVTAGITQVPGLVKVTNQGRDYVTGNTDIEQRVADKEIENRIQEAEKDGEKLSNKEKNKIAKQVQEDLERGYISTNTIEDTLGYNEIYNKLKTDTENMFGKDLTKEELQDIQSEARERIKNNLENNDYLLRSYEENTKKSQNYEADLSQYDEKAKKIIQKAINSKILNNTGKTHDFVDLIAKISSDKGIDFDFTNNEALKNSQFAVQGADINGYVKDGSIVLNIDSNKSLNSVVGHEITHILEESELYNTLSEAVKEYATTKGVYDKRLAKLTELYKGIENADVQKELTADLVGDYLFTDKEFINNLSTKNRNLFEKIYDEIKYLLKLATAGSKEARQLEKAKKMFEDAYRNSAVKNAEKTNSTQIKYSIEQKGAIENLNNIDGYEVQEDTYPYDNVIGHSFDLKTKEGTAHLQIRETADKVYLNMINTRLGNSTVEKGVGTKILNNLKDYCDKTGKQLVIAGEVSSASGFYDRFNWLTKENGIITDDDGNVFDINSPNRIYNPKSNTKYSLSTDNQGRELSKQQQDYFKDSKAVDENGNLEVMYHTTPSKFTVFDNSKLGENTEYDNTVFGFFVTPNSEFSNRFGDINNEGNKSNTMELYANVTNPITHPYNADYKYSGDELNNIVERYFEAIGEEEGLNELKSYVDDGDYDNLYEAYMNTVVTELSSPFENADYEKQLLEENGYDAVEFVEGNESNVIDGGQGNEPVISYAVFNSNQVKNTDNLNPTENEDIRYSLGQQTPTGSYNITGEDVRLQEAPIEQVNTSIQELTNKINELQQQISEIGRPTQIADEQAITQQYEEAPMNEVAPIRENLTQDQSEELDFLEDYFKQYMKDNEINNQEQLEAQMLSNYSTDADKQLYSMYKNLQELEQGIFEQEVADDEIVSRGLSDKELGKRKTKSYQYEHPEVKPYFQEQAKALLSELNESTFGERTFDSETYYNTDGELGWNGTKRDTSESLAKFKDSNNYTWAEIRQGLEDIIEDNSAENNAVSKKLELVIDDRLRNGYNNFGLDAVYLGKTTPPNQDYIKLLNQIETQEALSEIPINEIAPEIEEEENNDGLMEAFKGTRNEIRRTELQLALKNATGLEENLQQRVDKIKNEINKPVDIMELFYPESRKPINKAPQRQVITKSKTRNLIDNLKGMFVNENVEVDNLAKEYGRPDVKWAGDMLNNAFAEGQNDITVAQTDNYGREIGKGVNKLFQPAIDAGLYEPFNDFLLHYSNIDRHNNGKGSQTPLNVSENIVKAYLKSYPEFLPWAEEIWNYGKNCRDNMLEAGLIDKNYHKLLGDLYPHYVPYVSDAENFNQYMQNTGEIKPRGLKKAYGQAGKLLPVQEALTKYTFSMKKGIRQNALYNKIIDTLRGGEETELGTDDRTDYTNLDNGIYRDKNGAYLTAYDKGVARNVRISDDLYNSLRNDLKTHVKNIEDRLSLITNPLQKLSNIRRNILTSWSPTFPIKNALKDFQGALFNSKHTGKMLKNYPSAIKELATMKSPQVRQFVALYGSGNLMGQFDEKSYKSLGKNKFLRGISKANEVIELAPRYAEFKASIESGATLEEAMYNAREVTTNFSRGGTITKALNRNGFTFLNSSVQGFDKFIRNFSGENGAKGVASALLKAVMFGVAPALFNDLVFGSGDDKDEDYEALPNYIKDNYYLIKTSDNQFVRIPKGREFSVFGSAGRRALEAINGKENAFEGYLKNAWEQIGIGDLEQNNIIAPLLQAYGSENGKTWYGGDLVPTRLQDKIPEEQYDASTDRLSVWLGEQLGISPYKLNYVLDQYTGGIGDLLLPMITPEATNEGGLLAPITDQFTSNSITKNKYAGEFYDTMDKLKKLSNSEKGTDEDTVMYKYLSSRSKELSDLYKEKREVQESGLDKETKFKFVQNIQEQINDIAKDALDNYKNYSKADDYISLDGNDYYKDSEGKWAKAKDEVTNELNAYGLDAEEKNEYYSVNKSINNIKNTDEESSTKKSNIIDTIVNSNLTPDAKVLMYTNNYKDKNVEDLVDIGMNVDSYLTYKSQNFTADKDKNGKAINGTKKTKVFNYINSMNIPYEEKCILAKLEYNSYKDADRTIIEYLDKNPSISYETMVDLLKNMGFEINGNTIK